MKEPGEEMGFLEGERSGSCLTDIARRQEIASDSVGFGLLVAI